MYICKQISDLSSMFYKYKYVLEYCGSEQAGEKAMRSFGVERPKTVFAKVVLVFLLLMGVGVAKEPVVTIKTTPQVEVMLKNVSLGERKTLEKAISVGNRFVELYYTNQAGYDIEIEDEWSKMFKPLTTMSGEEWNGIQGGVSCSSQIFSLLGCGKIYLSFIAIDNDMVKLSYHSKVIGGSFNNTSRFFVTNKQFFNEFKDSFFVIDLSINKTAKITKVSFPNKITAKHYQTEINFISNESRNANVQDKPAYKNLTESIISASSICKE